MLVRHDGSVGLAPALLGAVVVSSLFAISTAQGAEDANNSWAQWRGPLASGVAPAADPPTTWAEGKNVKWKVKIPGRGSSTPIVWGDKIFIETAINTGKKPDGTAAEAAPTPPPPPPAGLGGPGGPGGRPPRGRGGPGGGMGVVKPTEIYQFVIMCLDRKTGETLWQKTAAECVPHEGHHPDHGFASYSPTTDGQNVYAYFGSRGLHCYDMAGNLKWEKDLGKMQTRNSFGEGSSPALFGDTIVVQWDHQGDDFIAAFDKTTGEEKWRDPRNEDTTWSTPLIVDYNGTAQVVASSSKKVRSYDLKTGKQIWEGPGLTQNVIPSPVSSEGVVYAISGFSGAALYAIKLGGTGDVTGTDSILWSAKKSTPYIPSPLLYGERLYFFANINPIFSCYDVKSGKPVLDAQRIDDLQNVYASPVGAAGKVYLLGRDGTCVVIKHMDQSNKVEVLATNKVDDRTDASPALVGKEMFLRGQEYLYCIGE